MTHPDYFATILKKWSCTAHGYQCYVVQPEDGVPEKVGQHIQIPNKIQDLWVDDCVHIGISKLDAY